MSNRKTANSGFDYMIFVPVALLMGLGLVVVYSASSQLALEGMGDGYFYLKRQALFCLLGLFVMITARYIPYHFYSKLAYPMLVISSLLLIALLVPGWGHKAGGACRWLRVGDYSFQPAELAKLSLTVYLAYSMAKKGSDMALFSKGLLPHLFIAGAFMALMVLQPDFGTAVIIGFWVLVLLYVGGVRFWHLLSVCVLSFPIVLWLIWRSDYRAGRWASFINPWEDPRGLGFQIIHSFLAFGSGGILGAGLGNSKQKLFFLPEPHTDFVLSIAAEEIGFVGIVGIVFLFALLIVRGIKVALNAGDLYSTYLAFGLTCLIGLQVLVNMGVVMGLLPTKGLTLPFISYGGSSMLINLLGIGMLLSISSRR